MRWRTLTRTALIVLITVLRSTADASDVRDSLRYLLESDATAEERASALCRLAQRNLDHDPLGALSYSANAVRFAEGTGDDALLHDALCAQRAVQFRLGLLPEHLTTTLRSLDIARKLSDQERLSADLHELAIAYQANGRHGKAVEQARLALAVATASNNAEAVARNQLFLLDALHRAGLHDEVVHGAEKALLHIAALPPLDQARLRQTIARALIAQRRFGDAIPYLAAAERILLDAGGPGDRFGLLLDQASLATGTGRFAEAQARIDSAATIPAGQGVEKKSVKLLQASHALAAARSDWPAAHAWLLRLQAARDSSNNALSDLALGGMQVVRELEAHEQEQQRLQLRADIAETELLDQKASYRLLLIAATLLLVMAIALGLLIRRARISARRSGLKSQVISRHKEEMAARNMELQRQNMRLAEALMREERQGLALGEMHHRLKNSLQAIDAVLQMQCGALSDPAARTMIREAQGRLRAMALLHAAIYRLGDDTAIPVGNHLEDLARLVLVANGRHDRISMNVDADTIRLHADELMPLSLIVNELLTNSLKHGIPTDAHGSIHIVLRAAGERLELRYSDDGKQDDSRSRAGSFGAELMRALAEQLNGEITTVDGMRRTTCLVMAPDSLGMRKAS